MILDLSSQLPEDEQIFTMDTKFQGTLPIPIRIGTEINLLFILDVG